MDTLRDKIHLEDLWKSGGRSMAYLTTSYWEGKEVLVTGHTGFKGMWLSIYLKNMGAKVFGISDFW